MFSLSSKVFNRLEEVESKRSCSLPSQNFMNDSKKVLLTTRYSSVHEFVLQERRHHRNLISLLNYKVQFCSRVRYEDTNQSVSLAKK
jgi:hypothetical protein